MPLAGDVVFIQVISSYETAARTSPPSQRTKFRQSSSCRLTMSVDDRATAARDGQRGETGRLGPVLLRSTVIRTANTSGDPVSPSSMLYSQLPDGSSSVSTAEA